MRQFERFIVYPLLALLGWAVLRGHTSRSPADDVMARTVTAEQYRVVDGARRERGRVETSDDGGCGLQLLAKDGTTRAALSVDGEGGTTLTMSDRGGVARVVVVLFASGRSGLVFHDGTGRGRLSAIVSPAGEPTLALLDRGGGARVELGLTGDGDGTLSIRGGDETALWTSPSRR